MIRPGTSSEPQEISDSSEDEEMEKKSSNIGNNSQIVKLKLHESPSTSNDVKRGPGRGRPRRTKLTAVQRASEIVLTILRDFDVLDDTEDEDEDEDEITQCDEITESGITDFDNSLMQTSDSDSYQTATTTTNTNNSLLVQHDDTNSQFDNVEMKTVYSVPTIIIENSETIISISSEENSSPPHQNDTIVINDDNVPAKSISLDTVKNQLNFNCDKKNLNKFKTETDGTFMKLLQNSVNLNLSSQSKNLNDSKNLVGTSVNFNLSSQLKNLKNSKNSVETLSSGSKNLVNSNNLAETSANLNLCSQLKNLNNSMSLVGSLPTRCKNSTGTSANLNLRSQLKNLNNTMSLIGTLPTEFKNSAGTSAILNVSTQLKKLNNSKNLVEILPTGSKNLPAKSANLNLSSQLKNLNNSNNLVKGLPTESVNLAGTSANLSLSSQLKNLNNSKKLLEPLPTGSKNLAGTSANLNLRSQLKNLNNSMSLIGTLPTGFKNSAGTSANLNLSSQLKNLNNSNNLVKALPTESGNLAGTTANLSLSSQLKNLNNSKNLVENLPTESKNSAGISANYNLSSQLKNLNSSKNLVETLPSGSKNLKDSINLAETSVHLNLSSESKNLNNSKNLVETKCFETKNLTESKNLAGTSVNFNLSSQLKNLNNSNNIVEILPTGSKNLKDLKNLVGTAVNLNLSSEYKTLNNVKNLVEPTSTESKNLKDSKILAETTMNLNLWPEFNNLDNSKNFVEIFSSGSKNLKDYKNLADSSVNLNNSNNLVESSQSNKSIDFKNPEEGSTNFNLTSQINIFSDSKIITKNIQSNTKEKKLENCLKIPTNTNDSNIQECRRSSRKKIMKYDVKDLFNLNKPKKIQIEARIDSLPPKLNTPIVNDKQKKISKIEVKDIIKKPVIDKISNRNVNNVIVKHIYNKIEIEPKIVQRKRQQSVNKEVEKHSLPNEQKDDDEFKKYKELFENKFKPNFQRKISIDNTKTSTPDNLNTETSTVVSSMLKSPLLNIKFKQNLANRQSLDSLRRASATSLNFNELNKSVEDLTRAHNFESTINCTTIDITNNITAEISEKPKVATPPNHIEKVKNKRGRPLKSKTPIKVNEPESNKNFLKKIVTNNESEKLIEDVDHLNEVNKIEKKKNFQIEKVAYNSEEILSNKFCNNKVRIPEPQEKQLSNIPSVSPNSQGNYSFEIVQGFKIFKSEVRIKRQKSIQKLSGSETDENVVNCDVNEKKIGTVQNQEDSKLKVNNFIIESNSLNNSQNINVITMTNKLDLNSTFKEEKSNTIVESDNQCSSTTTDILNKYNIEPLNNYSNETEENLLQSSEPSNLDENSPSKHRKTVIINTNFYQNKNIQEFPIISDKLKKSENKNLKESENEKLIKSQNFKLMESQDNELRERRDNELKESEDEKLKEPLNEKMKELTDKKLKETEDLKFKELQDEKFNELQDEKFNELQDKKLKESEDEKIDELKDGKLKELKEESQDEKLKALQNEILQESQNEKLKESENENLKESENENLKESENEKLKKSQDEKLDEKKNKDQSEHPKSNEHSINNLDKKINQIEKYEIKKKEKNIIDMELNEKSKNNINNNIDKKQNKKQNERKKNYEKYSKIQDQSETENLKLIKKSDKIEKKAKQKNKYDNEKISKMKDIEKIPKNLEKRPEDLEKNYDKLTLPKKTIDKLNDKIEEENLSIIKKPKIKQILDFEKHLQEIEEISKQRVKSRDKRRLIKKSKEGADMPRENQLTTNDEVNKIAVVSTIIQNVDGINKNIVNCASVENVDINKSPDQIGKSIEINNSINLISESNKLKSISAAFDVTDKVITNVNLPTPTERDPIENSNENNWNGHEKSNSFEAVIDTAKSENVEVGTKNVSTELTNPTLQNNTISTTTIEMDNKNEMDNKMRNIKGINCTAEDPLKDIEKFIEAAGNLLSRSHDTPDQNASADSQAAPPSVPSAEYSSNNNFPSTFNDNCNEIFVNPQTSSLNSSNTEISTENRKFGPRTPPFPPPQEDSFDFNPPPKPEINLTSLSKKNEKNFKKSLRKLKKNDNISNELKQTIKELKKLKKKSTKNENLNLNDEVGHLTNSSNEESNNTKENNDGGRRRSHRIKRILKTNYSSVGRGLVRDRERLVGVDSIECGPYPDLSEIEAQNAKFLKDMEERLSQFKVIKDNEYKCERVITKEAKKMICDCFLTREEEERGEYGCGEDCLNRLLMIECGPNCTVGERCTNRRFQRGQYAPCKVFRTEKKGFGIMADAEIQAGEFIMEYVGEVLNSEQFYKKANIYSKDKNKHHYFMALRSDAIIDATSRGNISRFINHSCEPNAQTQKWTVNGELRIGFFTTRSVLPGEEITFDYKFQRYGKEAQKCFCEAPTCRGWIGEEPDSEDEMRDDDDIEGENDNQEENDKDDDLIEDRTKITNDVINEDLTEDLSNKENVSKEIRKSDKKRKQMKKYNIDVGKLDFLEDPDLEDEVARLRQSGLKNQAHTLKLSRLLVRAKLQETRLNLLEILRNGDIPCLKLFLDYHGLKLLYGWMNDTEDKEDLLKMRLDLLKTLQILPIISKTVLKDSKVYQTVESWYENINNSEEDMLLENNQNSTEIEIKNISEKLLKEWDQLPEIFRIPRKERVEQMKEHEREADRQYTALKLFDDEHHDVNQRNRDRFQRTKYSNNSTQIQSSSGNKFKWSRDNTSKADPRLDQSRMSKIERRQLFAAKVAQTEAHKRMADERREFEVKCKYYWLNPNTHPKDVPFCVNTNTGQWYTKDKRKIPTPPSHVHLLPQPKNLSKNISDYKLPPMSLPPFWKCAIDPQKGGRIYYYHVKIRIPQWDPPIKLLPLTSERTEIKPSNDENEESSETDTDSDVTDDEDENSTANASKRYQLLVQERPISPRRDEDRMYNQIEMRRYKENKEKVRKRKEEIKRRKAQLRDISVVITSESSSSDSPSQNSDKLDKIVLPIADYLLSSDEDDTILSDFDSKLLEKIVQGEKCIDELDALQTRKLLKRHLINVKDRSSNSPIRESKKRKLEEKIKNKLNDEEVIKKSKSGNSSKQNNSKYMARKAKEKFRTEIAGIILQHLTPYRKDACKIGRITSEGDFEHLTRKLTHFVTVKELKHCDATGQMLIVTDSVKNKSREFIKKYMTKYGETYKRPENDPEFRDILR